MAPPGGGNGAIFIPPIFSSIAISDWIFCRSQRLRRRARATSERERNDFAFAASERHFFEWAAVVVAPVLRRWDGYPGVMALLVVLRNPILSKGVDDNGGDGGGNDYVRRQRRVRPHCFHKCKLDSSSLLLHALFIGCAWLK